MAHDPRAEIEAANRACSVAAILLKQHIDFMQRFAEERIRFESVGPIIAPTLYNNRERQAVSDALAPIYEAARRFVAAHAAAHAALNPSDAREHV